MMTKPICVLEYGFQNSYFSAKTLIFHAFSAKTLTFFPTRYLSYFSKESFPLGRVEETVGDRVRAAVFPAFAEQHVRAVNVAEWS